MPTIARFSENIDRSGGPDACHLWTASRDKNGYGWCRHVGERKAHRGAWVDANGPIPSGLQVCHSCDNPPCCNPAHMFLGTNAVNHADKAAKGRAPRGERQWAAKLTPEIVRSVRERRASGEIYRTIAGDLAVSVQVIAKICTRRIWRHVA